ncbi:MAG TPA: HD domain-containing protein, partial [Bryobacteraceae bacterium]|nr:HD domain-containing protein [Bryobacteraceae bacterium]
FTDYFPASKRNPDEMLRELLGIVRGIGNPHLRRLVLALIEDAEIAARYKLAPAAKNIHHAYLGGLIEHVLSLCGLARLTAAHYPNIDLDLLLTGVVLHDIGKVEELTWHRSFGYTSNGQLLGHIVIALRMIDEKLRLMPDFPARLRTLVEHMIVSHHGELEFGSPKVPLFPEALLLHHLDNLDSKMECMRAFIEKDRHVEGCWTGYSSSLERTVLKKSLYLDDTPVPVRKEDIADVAPRPVPSSEAEVRHPQPPAHVAAAPPGPPPVHAQAQRPHGASPACAPMPGAPGMSPAAQRPLTPGQPMNTSPVQPPRRPIGPAHPAMATRPPQQPGIPSLFGEKLMGALQDDKENS